MGEVSVGFFWDPSLWRFGASRVTVDGCASMMIQCLFVSFQVSVYA